MKTKPVSPFIVVLAALALAACSKPAPEPGAQPAAAAPAAAQQAPQAPQPEEDVEAVVSSGPFSGYCAVFYSPDEARQAALIKQLGEDSVITLSDDNTYYELEARKYYAKRALKVYSASVPVLVFKTGDGRTFTVDTAANKAPWGVLLFDGKKAPAYGDLVSPEETSAEYFRK